MFWHVARRDLVSAFTTPLAWLVIACWTLLTNAVFVFFGLYAVQGSSGSSEPLFVGTLSMGLYFLTLLSPALTMNSFASERTQGTMQLLLTVPIREFDLVFGKFLAAFLLLATLAGTTLVQILVLHVVSAVHLPHLVAGYLGFLLVSALLSALGIWISLLVDTAVAAYVITFGAIFVLLLFGSVPEDSLFGVVGKAIGLSVRTQGFFDGQIRSGDLAFFLTGSCGFLTLAHAALCARRLHG